MEGEGGSIANRMGVHILWRIKVVMVVRLQSAKSELGPCALAIQNVWSLLTENKVLLCLWVLEIVMGEIYESLGAGGWGGSLNTKLEVVRLQAALGRGCTVPSPESQRLTVGSIALIGFRVTFFPVTAMFYVCSLELDCLCLNYGFVITAFPPPIMEQSSFFTRA